MVPNPRRLMAVCFRSGKGGENVTELDLRTPSGRVTSTTSAVKEPLLVDIRTLDSVSSNEEERRSEKKRESF